MNYRIKITTNTTVTETNSSWSYNEAEQFLFKLGYRFCSITYLWTKSNSTANIIHTNGLNF